MHRYLTLLLTSLIALPLVANPDGESARVLILGTHHFSGSSDFIQGAPEDVLSERRQREVEELVKRLAQFGPTRIALEVPIEIDAELNERYEAYRAGTHTLSRSESEQIGFRLGKLLDHPKLYAIDYKLDEDIGRVVKWAVEHGDMEFVEYVQGFGARMQEEMERAQALPLLEILRRQNTPEYDALHSAYLRMVRVGTATEPVGADVVAGRYERNLKIFANLARIAEPGDRILVIYGASHGKLLRDFVRESDELELEPIEPYLTSSAASTEKIVTPKN